MSSPREVCRDLSVLGQVQIARLALRSLGGGGGEGRGWGRPEFRTGPRNPTPNIQKKKNDFKKSGEGIIFFFFCGRGCGSGGVFSRHLKDHRLSPPLRFGGLLRQSVEQVFVDRGVHVARVRVSLHERVDLQLGVVERVQGGLLHVPVDRLTHPGVEAHLRSWGGGGRKKDQKTLHRLSEAHSEQGSRSSQTSLGDRMEM